MTTSNQLSLQDLQSITAAIPTDIFRGVHSNRVDQLRQLYGANTFHNNKHSWIKLLLRQFNSGFTYLLLGVVGIYFLLGEWINGLVMLVIVTIMALFGFYEEFYADKTLQNLSGKLRFHVRVVRDGREIMVEADDIVVGDLVVVLPGDAICADIRLVTAENLNVDEASITGESCSVIKKESVKELNPDTAANCMLYAGTKVVAGKASGIVVATGTNTAFGQLITLTFKQVRLSNFSQGINKFSLFVLYVVFGTMGIIFCSNFFLNRASINIFQLLIFYISLAVAVVPQALQAVINFALARSAAILAKREVLVKRFVSLEDLASVEILCVDKTGTLTENHLSVANVKGIDGWTSEKVLIAAWYAVAAKQKKYTEPFDIALMEYFSSHTIVKELPLVLNQIPFDPIHKRNVTFFSSYGCTRSVMRGAFESVTKSCKNSEFATCLKVWIDEQESLGCRVLTIAEGVAEIHGENITGLQLVGAVAFKDKIKKTALAAMYKARAMHVAVKMLTGDSPIIARHVAQELKIFGECDDVITGDVYDTFSDEEKNNIIIGCNVFARVSPLQKYDIILRLRNKYDVGFLGEGINDIPSIKAATVGFAVNNAVDAARDAADIVLLTKSIDVIVEGIHHGRAVFINSIKYLRLTLSSNFSNFFTMAIISLINGTLPMLPIQLLVVNLLSDLPMLFIATDNVEKNDLEYPTSSNVRELVVMTVFFGAVCTVFDFIFFSQVYSESPKILQTSWFVFSLWTELVLFFSIRSKGCLWLAVCPSWQMLLALVVVGCVGTFLPFTVFGQKNLHLTPLGVSHFCYMAAVLMLNVFTIEVIKTAWYRNKRCPVLGQ